MFDCVEMLRPNSGRREGQPPDNVTQRLDASLARVADAPAAGDRGTASAPWFPSIPPSPDDAHGSGHAAAGSSSGVLGVTGGAIPPPLSTIVEENPADLVSMTPEKARGDLRAVMYTPATPDDAGVARTALFGRDEHVPSRPPLASAAAVGHPHYLPSPNAAAGGPCAPLRASPASAAAPPPPLGTTAADTTTRSVASTPSVSSSVATALFVDPPRVRVALTPPTAAATMAATVAGDDASVVSFSALPEFQAHSMTLDTSMSLHFGAMGPDVHVAAAATAAAATASAAALRSTLDTPRDPVSSSADEERMLALVLAVSQPAAASVSGPF
jgi:hypothetical protein